MRLIYEGQDITDSVRITEASHRDASRGRRDSLEVTLDDARTWTRWGPKANDAIEIVEGGYSTGRLYLNAIWPEGREYRLLATSAPLEALHKASRCYVNITLEELMGVLASECGMEWRLWGLDGGIRYRTLIRSDEGCLAFLERVLGWEGAVLKTYNGRMTAIGILAAQELPAGQTITITGDDDACRYWKRLGGRRASLTVRTPYASARADDTEADGPALSPLCDIPAMDAATAGRWARGRLLTENRLAEEATIQSEFNGYFTAMARVDITGATHAAGEWLIDEAEHDFVNGRSRATLLRSIRSIR